jgi:23S rRNA (uracil1939-C5)-methyltransferase
MSAPTPQPETAEIVDTLVDGRGVVQTSGKTVFVHGAIKGDKVSFVRRKKKRGYDEADLVEILRPGPDRVTPRCEAFGMCGGCSLQHLSSSRQLDLKQTVLLESLKRIGSVEPTRVLEPLSGEVWGYRRKARLAVKYVHRKERVLVGFRERNKPFVTDMQRCETLHPAIGDHLPGLVELIEGMSIRERIPQIEAAAGDDAVAMIFRVLDPPTPADLDRFSDFESRTGVLVYLQSKGPDTIARLPGSPAHENLIYRVPAYDAKIEFTATDFIQVHGAINRSMIDQAIDLLQPDSQSRVLDLFCGLGNFSIPLATRAREVVGIELATDMVRRARENAAAAGIDNIHFDIADLSDPAGPQESSWQGFDQVLLDPPRTGALEMMPVLEAIGAARVLYISCHPGTLARDAGHLVRDLGYDLEAAGVVDMFPHTSHVESMALFRR